MRAHGRGPDTLTLRDLLRRVAERDLAQDLVLTLGQREPGTDAAHARRAPEPPRGGAARQREAQQHANAHPVSHGGALRRRAPSCG
jgi:hypothetical protein